MRIAVLGAGGMLGFALHRVLHYAGRDVVGLVRGAPPSAACCRGLVYGPAVDALTPVETVLPALHAVRADVVLNAIGVGTRADVRLQWSVHAALPAVLAGAADRGLFRLVQISTDGVFDGTSGGYTEAAQPRPVDSYGWSKLAGEHRGRGVTILRTSMIGRALSSGDGLVDWLLGRTGTVGGFRRVLFSGLPVGEIARLLDRHVLDRLAELEGLWHVASEPITKADVLRLVVERWSRTDIEIVDVNEHIRDLSLNASRWNRATGYAPPAWPTLIASMHSFYSTVGLDRQDSDHLSMKDSQWPGTWKTSGS